MILPWVLGVVCTAVVVLSSGCIATVVASIVPVPCVFVFSVLSILLFVRFILLARVVWFIVCIGRTFGGSIALRIRSWGRRGVRVVELVYVPFP